ncbi:unnamed protein product [Moneuplotes crassus]|uniref:Mitochondrial cardiolipin hydrolase n=1 Tax=Euplotes crassus TaxID=5936 RepID=A0AAD1XA35_EUPCR|nr:unnamed protein product [Moneuplotes crassus]
MDDTYIPEEPLCTSLNSLILNQGEGSQGLNGAIPFHCAKENMGNEQEIGILQMSELENEMENHINAKNLPLDFVHGDVEMGNSELDQLEYESQSNVQAASNNDLQVDYQGRFNYQAQCSNQALLNQQSDPKCEDQSSYAYDIHDTSQLHADRGKNIEFKFHSSQVATKQMQNGEKQFNCEKIDDGSDFPLDASIYSIEDTNDSVELIEDMNQIDLISNTIPEDPILVQEPPKNYISYDESEIEPDIVFSGLDLNNSQYIKETLEKCLLSAKNTVKICNYSIGQGVISPSLLSNVIYNIGDSKKLQVITDKCQWSNLEKYSEQFRTEGIEIKVNKHSNVLMHCKFMIIDSKTLIHGSMNLGNQSMRNYEHFIITKDKSHISKFKQRFNNMWGKKRHFVELPHNSQA